MNSLISLRDVGKKYDSSYVLKHITLDIKPGDSIVFTGHNGMGKSTLLKIIGNLVRNDEGIIQYMPNIKIGYVPEHFPKMNISASTYVMNMAQIQGLTAMEARKKCNELFENLFMSNMVHTPIKYLSKGTLQKVAVIQALLVKSDVLLLDEPLSGQDNESQRYFIKCIKRLNEEGTSVVMSCHEKWLMNMISKTVYEISNKTITKKTDISPCLYDYIIMYFERGEQLRSENIGNSFKIEELALKIEIHQKIVVIYAKRENCKIILLKMMEYGYELRRMIDENME